MGFVIDFIEIQTKLSKGVDVHAEEKKYYRRKRILPSIERKYHNGDIDEKTYQKWIAKYKALEERYGQ